MGDQTFNSKSGKHWKWEKQNTKKKKKMTRSQSYLHYATTISNELFCYFPVYQKGLNFKFGNQKAEWLEDLQAWTVFKPKSRK